MLQCSIRCDSERFITNFNFLSTFCQFLGYAKKPVQSFSLRGNLTGMKKKIIKLNPLQGRTLALFQLLAKSPESSTTDPATGEVSIAYFPRPHGDHVHIGDFVVSGQDASGFANAAVWRALERKGLIKADFPLRVILTRAGRDFETGYRDQFDHSDH